jgi:translation elongation factor EF-Ts
MIPKLMKSLDKAADKHLAQLASQLSLHVAAMKPIYLHQEDVP